MSTCSDVIGTSDAGKTWSLPGTVKAPLATLAHSGITDLRFATPGGLGVRARSSRTTDGGLLLASQQIPGGGKQILSLAACRPAPTPSCRRARVVNWPWPPAAQPLAHQRTPLGGAWTSIPLDLPVNASADVAMSGRPSMSPPGSAATAGAGSTPAPMAAISRPGPRPAMPPGI